MPHQMDIRTYDLQFINLSNKKLPYFPHGHQLINLKAVLSMLTPLVTEKIIITMYVYINWNVCSCIGSEMEVLSVHLI